jgi:hypothetical protein
MGVHVATRRYRSLRDDPQPSVAYPVRELKRPVGALENDAQILARVNLGPRADDVEGVVAGFAVERLQQRWD